MLGRLIFLSSMWDLRLPSSQLRLMLSSATIESVRHRIEVYFTEAAPVCSYIWSDFTCKQINEDLGTSLVACHDTPPPAPFDDYDLIVVAEPICPIDIENLQLEYEMGMGGMDMTWGFADSTESPRQPPREPKKLCHYPPFGDWKNIN